MKAYRLQFTSFDGFPLEAICKTPQECLEESEYAQSRCWRNPEEIEVADDYFDDIEIEGKTIKEYINNQEHIRFENMCYTYFHSFYSQYGYKSIGMILRLLHTYCNLNMAEHHSVGDSKIFYYGNENKVFATFVWDETKQMAILDFKDGFSESTDNYKENQRIFLKGLKNGWKHL